MNKRLLSRVESGLKLAHQCKANYRAGGFCDQYNYARGQIDAFNAVMKWINQDCPADQRRALRFPANGTTQQNNTQSNGC